MRQQGVFGRQNKRYRLRTTDSHHDEPIAPNRLAMAPAATRPNQIWAEGIQLESLFSLPPGRNPKGRSLFLALNAWSDCDRVQGLTYANSIERSYPARRPRRCVDR